MFTIFITIRHDFDYFNHIHTQFLFIVFSPRKLQKTIECKTLFSHFKGLSLFLKLKIAYFHSTKTIRVYTIQQITNLSFFNSDFY
jgi:hypothetical protein